MSPVGAAEHAAAARGVPGTKPWESLVSDLLQFADYLTPNHLTLPAFRNSNAAISRAA